MLELQQNWLMCDSKSVFLLTDLLIHVMFHHIQSVDTHVSHLLVSLFVVGVTGGVEVSVDYLGHL